MVYFLSMKKFLLKALLILYCTALALLPAACGDQVDLIQFHEDPRIKEIVDSGENGSFDLIVDRSPRLGLDNAEKTPLEAEDEIAIEIGAAVNVRLINDFDYDSNSIQWFLNNPHNPIRTNVTQFLVSTNQAPFNVEGGPHQLEVQATVNGVPYRTGPISIWVVK